MERTRARHVFCRPLLPHRSSPSRRPLAAAASSRCRRAPGSYASSSPPPASGTSWCGRCLTLSISTGCSPPPAAAVRPPARTDHHLTRILGNRVQNTAGRIGAPCFHFWDHGSTLITFTLGVRVPSSTRRASRAHHNGISGGRRIMMGGLALRHHSIRAARLAVRSPSQYRSMTPPGVFVCRSASGWWPSRSAS